MRRCLLAVAKDRQLSRVFARQCIAGNRTGCRGTNSSDFPGMSSTDGSATFRVEQNYQPLMRLNATSEVIGENADQLGAEHITLAHGTRHDAEQAPVRQRDDRPQQLTGLATRKRHHGVAHDRDTLLVRQPLPDFFAVNESHVTRA